MHPTLSTQHLPLTTPQMEQSRKRVAAADSEAGGAAVVDSDPSGAESLASSFLVGVGEVGH